MRPGLKKRKTNQESFKKAKEEGCRKSRTFRSIGDLNAKEKSAVVAEKFWQAKTAAAAARRRAKEKKRVEEAQRRASKK